MKAAYSSLSVDELKGDNFCMLKDQKEDLCWILMIKQIFCDYPIDEEVKA